MTALVITEPGGMVVLVEGKGIPSTDDHPVSYMSANFEFQGNDRCDFDYVGNANGNDICLVKSSTALKPANTSLMWWVKPNYRNVLEHELLLAITLAQAGLRFTQKGMTIALG